MAKLIVVMHVTLDGFVAGKKGEMDWISFDEELFDFVGGLTDKADTVLYGRKTFDLMDRYWPTAGDKPGASKHDKEHAAWYNKITKFVVSNTLKGQDKGGVRFINGDLTKEINAIKQGSKSSVLIFGSPSVVRALLLENLIDAFYLFVNPVLIGEGISMWGQVRDRLKLKFQSATHYKAGVVMLHCTAL
jgi:dihydrofolate reductase